MTTATTDREKLTADNLLTVGPGLWTAGGGLYLRVTGSGTRSWVYRFMIANKQREMGLGSIKDVKTITAARKLRDDAALVKAQKLNPIEARREKVAAAAVKEAKVMTFELATKGWLAKKTPELSSPKYRFQIESQIERYAYPTLAKVPVDQITTQMAHSMLDGLWAEKTPTATKLRGHCEEVWDWAKTTLKFPAVGNPFTWHGNLKHVLSRPNLIHKSTPHAAVPWRQMPAFMKNLRTRSSVSARLLEFTILTAARTQESLYCKVGEIDAAERIWTTPEERMKGTKNAKTEHRVPLSDRAMAIYREHAAGKKADDYLFSHPDGRHLSSGAMDKLFEIMGVAATAHGTARSSFRTWAENAPEAKSFREGASKAALHHKLGDETDRSYQRGDLLEHRAELMQVWCDYCAK